LFSFSLFARFRHFSWLPFHWLSPCFSLFIFSAMFQPFHIAISPPPPLITLMSHYYAFIYDAIDAAADALCRFDYELTLLSAPITPLFIIFAYAAY
jgi:hypothetical protein